MYKLTPDLQSINDLLHAVASGVLTQLNQVNPVNPDGTLEGPLASAVVALVFTLAWEIRQSQEADPRVRVLLLPGLPFFAAVHFMAS